MSLDPDDPRPPYVQIANALRAAILTKSLAPGEQLPSGNELAKRYGVARMTVQQAFKVLRDEGLIVSRQGSGVFVRERTERPVGLRPHIERAFDRAEVSIDFAGFSGETLHGALHEPLDKIRVGRLTPKTISIRALIADTSIPWTLPCRVEDLADDPDFRERAQQIALRHTEAVTASVLELADLGLVEKGSVEIRAHNCTPLFKLFILNGEEAFFGFYPVREHAVTVKGEPRSFYDLMGKDAVLFHHEATQDDTATGTQYVQQARAWFDSMWNIIGHPFPHDD
jgi:DNA-binding transcriptional regulator YhcF (GntR family)